MNRTDALRALTTAGFIYERPGQYVHPSGITVSRDHEPQPSWWVRPDDASDSLAVGPTLTSVAADAVSAVDDAIAALTA